MTEFAGVANRVNSWAFDLKRGKPVSVDYRDLENAATAIRILEKRIEELHEKIKKDRAKHGQLCYRPEHAKRR